MKKNRWRFVFLALAIWGFFRIFPGILANVYMLILNIQARFSPNMSVGIIGGADGPTAIFLTSNPAWIHYVLPVLTIVVGIIGYIKLKKAE